MATDEEDDDEDGVEEFCAHGNLIDSEDCDECSDELVAIAEMFDRAEESHGN